VSTLDVERLREAIYAISVRHEWANYVDSEDRTEEIAAEYAALPHPDANVVERNHYAWFFPPDWPKELPESFLADTEAKMLEAIDDPFVDDAARIMLVFIAELRRLRAIETAAHNVSRCHRADDYSFKGDLTPCPCGWHRALAAVLV